MNLKSIIVLFILMFVFLFTACNREPITADFTENTESEESEEAVENEESVGNEEAVESEEDEDGWDDSYAAIYKAQLEKDNNYEYRDNPYREFVKKNEMICIEFDFGNGFTVEEDTVEEKIKKWNKIKALPEVEDAVMYVFFNSRIRPEIEKINPDYLVSYGELLPSIIQKGYKDFQVHTYTSDSFTENYFSIFHTTEEKRDIYNEKWPLHVEEGDIFTLYYDALDEDQTADISIDKITEDIPWYMNKYDVGDKFILGLVKEDYEKLVGEDITGKNITGLYGQEVFLVKSKKGKFDVLKEKLVKLDCKGFKDELFLTEE